MSRSPDVTAILTAHAEGELAAMSLASFERAIAHARQSGLSVEGLIVLDRADPATRAQFAGVYGRHRVIMTDEGDPGQARNAGIAAAIGQFVTFLDGDDLWSSNWVVLAHQMCAAEPDKVIAHSEINIVFGEERFMWWHADSRLSGFDPTYLRTGNYWDSMSCAARLLFQRFPFVANDLRLGFGHEDWHWNCVTVAAGIDHRPAIGTVHFKRQRPGSQMAECKAIGAVPWVTPLTSYGWTGGPAASQMKKGVR
jgi:glycosyltransferase involved in cell wall biosynthesis